MQSKEEVDADTSGDEAEEEPHGHKVHLVLKMQAWCLAETPG